MRYLRLDELGISSSWFSGAGKYRTKIFPSFFQSVPPVASNT